MSKLTNRVKQLETKSGKGERMKYICITGMNNSPDERAKGYKIQPFIKSAGGTDGEPFYLATLEEVQAFGERPDVELILIQVEYASEVIRDEQPRNT